MLAAESWGGGEAHSREPTAAADLDAPTTPRDDFVGEIIIVLSVECSL